MGISKGILKFLLILLLIGVILVLFVFGMRIYNSNKYKNYSAVGEEVNYRLPTDLGSYNLNIDGVEVVHIKGDYLNGFHLKPDEIQHKGVIITFGGSEGSPSYEIASRLSQDGYEVLSLFFFGMKNQQRELVRVPLEFFQEVLAYCEGNVEDDSVITVYGASKGAELALNLAVRYSEINNIILVAPAEFSYMGLSFSNREMQSSWTWEGIEVPFIDMAKGDAMEGIKMMFDMITGAPVAYRGSYESAAKGDPNREEARIKVENTDANILLIAGTDDLMWQSDIAAESIYKQRSENTEKLIYEGAGHIFFQDRYFNNGSMVLVLGGNLETNEEAGRESNIILLERLEEWHK